MFNCTHWQYINNYYMDIVSALHNAMISCVPIHRSNYFKPFWNDELRILNKLLLMHTDYGSSVINRKTV